MALGDAGCRQFRVDLVGGPWRLQRGLALGDLPPAVANELDPAADRGVVVVVVGGPGTDLLVVSGGREAPPGAATDGLADPVAAPALAAPVPRGSGVVLLRAANTAGPIADLREVCGGGLLRGSGSWTPRVGPRPPCVPVFAVWVTGLLTEGPCVMGMF